MGIIERITGGLDRVGAALVNKGQQSVLSSGTLPPEVLAAMVAAGMDTSTILGPGAPLPPAFPLGTRPRAFDYPAGSNISSRPRQSERVSFDTLRRLVENYDVAQIAISHRVDSIRAVEWKIVPEEGFDVSDLREAIKYAHRMMLLPDGELPFDAWLSKFAYDVLAFDAGALYKMRDQMGNYVGLDVIDGTTIAPLLDEYGRRPGQDPATGVWAPAYQQYVQGMGTVDLTAQDLVYIPFRPTSKSLYGRAPIESILLNANVDLRYQAYFMQTFTDGNIPSMFAISPEGWTPDQVTEFQDAWDAFLAGNMEAKSQVKWVPAGTSFSPVNDKNAAFSNEMALWLMRKTASAFHVTPTDLGFTDMSNRSTGESQESVTERVADRPLAGHIGGILTRFLQDDVGLPLKFEFQLDTDDEDGYAQAQKDEIYIRNGVVSSSDIAELRFGLTDAPEERVPRFIYTTKDGPIPLSSLTAASTAIDPTTGAPLPLAPAEQLAIAPVETPMDAAAAPAAKAELRKYAAYVDERARRPRPWRDFTFQHWDARTARELNRAGATRVRKEEGVVSVAGLVVYAADTGRVLMLQRALDPLDPAQGMWEFPGGHIEEGESPTMAAFREWQEETGCPLESGVPAAQWVSPDGIYAGFVYRVETEASIPCRIGSTSILNPDDPDGDCVETVAWWDPAQLVGNPAVRAELSGDLGLVFAALALAQQPAVPADADLLKGLGDEFVAEVLEALAAGPGSRLPSGEVLGSGENPWLDAVADPEGERYSTGFVNTDTGRAVVISNEPDTAEHGFAVGNTSFHDGGDPRDVHPGFVDSEGMPPFVSKGWRDTARLTPQHDYDLELTDHYSPLITDALTSWVDDLPLASIIEGLAAELPPVDDAVEKDDAQAALARKARDAIAQQAGDRLLHIPPELTKVLVKITEDGYTAGQHAAAVQLAGHKIDADGVAPSTLSIDWDNWTPGNPPAAAAAENGGLRALTDQAGITVKGITDSAFDDMGNRIASGLLAGDPPDKIGRDLRDLIGDNARADRIAHTESTRAVIASTFDTYQASGVGQWNMLLADGACEECQAVADANPHESFDLNDAPPIHPYCRCASEPVADSVTIDSVTAADPTLQE